MADKRESPAFMMFQTVALLQSSALAALGTLRADAAMPNNPRLIKGMSVINI
jgi:hypothetical protein